MKSYRALAIKELFAQRVTSVLVLIAVILSTMMTTIVGQSLGVLTAMREPLCDIFTNGRRSAPCAATG